MLAYLSVAQYDALVATWNYKYSYKRPAPYKVDATVRVALPLRLCLPTHPKMPWWPLPLIRYLKAMFPGEVPFLDAKLAEHQNSRLWAGMNVSSDLAAGST